MDAVTAWVSAHALVLWIGLILLAALAVFVHWRGRPDKSDDLPVPLLRKRWMVAVLLAALTSFAVIAMSIRAEGRVVSLDHRVTAGVAAALGDGALRTIAGVTELGDTDLLTAFGVLVALALAIRRHALLAAAWSITVLGSSFMISLFKTIFERPRPEHAHGFALETTWSFPSGHAAGSMVFYGMLAYVLMVRLPARWHRFVLIGACVVIASIAVSRVLLQVHYLSDVCAGLAIGLGWLVLCVGATDFLRTAHRPALGIVATRSESE